MQFPTLGDYVKLYLYLIDIAVLRGWQVQNHARPVQFPVFQRFDRARPYMTVPLSILYHSLVAFCATCDLNLAMEATTRKYEGISCHRWR